jgi:hypothetical protein
MKKDESTEVYFDETIGVEYFVNHEANKRPFPRDKYIYEDKISDLAQSEKDMIYLNKLGRAIEITSCSFILLIVMSLLAVLVWAKFN